MATAVVSVPGLAEAACINTGGSNYECSGALTTPQPFSGAGVAVTTTPGFSVNTTGGVAIDINGTGPLSYTDTNTSNLTGTSGGISIVQTNGPGTVTVLTGGTVTATEAAGTGIHAFGSQSGTGASVNAAAVSGGRIGINVQNIGSGLTQVIASGPVTGSNWYGIVAANNQILLDPSGDFNAAVAYGGTTPTDVIVRASGGVTGGLTGVLAWNGGAGELQVDTRGGAVSGGTRDGIVALSYPFGIGNTPTNLSVTSDAVSGARHGIVAINAGSGENTVTAYGAVSGASGYGIAAVNGAYNARDLINDGVITITGAAGTDLTVTAHGPVSGGLAGIYANNQGTGATQLTAAALVQGGTYGIRAENGEDAGDLKVNVANVTGGTGVSLVSASRTGAINVVASGPVVGTTGDGINTYNRFDIRSLSVTATSVEGARNGITVLSESDTPSAHINGGFITISASGLVKGVAGDGIYADNSATLGAGGGMNIDVAEVSGGRHGILALTNGLVIGNLINGALTITTRGSVTGFSGDGIHAEHAGDAEISINAQAAVSGGAAGIYALHTGAGATTINATGPIQGGTYGVRAENNNNNSGDLKVNVANVTGGTGVSLVSASRTGVINVVASGPVVGTTGDGINTYNRFDIRSLSVTATSVEGARNGITVLSESDTPSAHINGGFITISASGLVKGVAGDGIYADNSATLGAGGGMNIDVAEVSGGRHGILALTNGLVIGNLINGALTITTRGSVTGFSGDGIHAEHAGDAEISINAQAAVSGGVTGIYALHTGAGATTITAGGAVSGGTAAIDAISAGAPIRIDVAGTGSLRNASGALSDLAVRTSGGQANLTNAGLIAGTMNLSGAGNTVGNAGVWATAGTSLFGGATDVVTNQIGGAIVASGMTRFDNLGLIVNQGRITMLNGVTGDVLQTSGNARFDAGSIFAVDIGGANQSDRFVAAGTATLTGGTIAVNVQSPLQAGARYTVLTGNGGVNGQFSALSGGTAFLTLQDSYDANNVYLDVIKYRNFAEAGLTANQIATAGGLESLGAGPLYSAVANLFTDAQARNAFDQLSGEAHASLRTALVEDSRFMRSGAIDRLRGAFDAPGAPVIPVMSYAQGGPVMVRGAPQERFAIWAQAYGSWGHWSGNGNAAKLTRSTGGFTVGIDTLAFADWRIGLLAGYSSTGIGARAASGNSDNYHLGGYAGTQWGPVGVRVGLIETWHDIRATRQVVFPGFSDLLQGSYRGNTTQVFGDIGYRLTYGRMAFEPFANLAYVHLRTDGFREIGGPAALISQGRTMSTTFTTLGLRASMQFDLGGIEVTARGTVGWRHAFGAVTPRALFAFAGGAPFGIDGAAIARNAAVLEAGLDIPLAPRATFGLSYAAQLARRASDQTFKANLAVKF